MDMILIEGDLCCLIGILCPDSLMLCTVPVWEQEPPWMEEAVGGRSEAEPSPHCIRFLQMTTGYAN